MSAFHPSSHMNRDVRVNMRSPAKLETYFHDPNTYSHQTCLCGDMIQGAPIHKSKRLFNHVVF